MFVSFECGRKKSICFILREFKKKIFILAEINRIKSDYCIDYE